jgi:hypothetical protein
VVAVGVGVILAVILVTGGVVAESNTPDTLAFFGVSVRTTSAQIFLTGAICTWALLAAAWLLAAGVRRSRERGAQLAALKGRAGRPGGRGDAVQPPALADLFGLAAVPASAASGPGPGERRIADRPGTRYGRGDPGSEQDAPE